MGTPQRAPTANINPWPANPALTEEELRTEAALNYDEWPHTRGTFAQDALRRALDLLSEERLKHALPPTLCELRARGVRLHDVPPVDLPRPLVALTAGDRDGDDKLRAYAVLDPVRAAFHLRHETRCRALTLPQRLQLADLYRDGPERAPEGRLRGPWMRVANALVRSGLATLDRDTLALTTAGKHAAPKKEHAR